MQTALATARDERYQTAKDLADELGRILVHEPILARPDGTLKRVVRWARRHPQVALLVAVLTITLPTIAALGAIYIQDRPRVAAALEARLAEERDALLSAASFELAEGTPKRALELYEQALQIGRETPEAAAGIAFCHIRSGDAVQALAVLDSKASLIGEGAAGVMLRADALRKNGEADAAAQLENSAPAPQTPFDHLVFAERALAAGEDGDQASFTIALLHVTRAILLSDGPRLLLFELRAHIAGHLRDPAVINETVAVLESRWGDAARALRWAGFALARLETREGAMRAVAALKRAADLDPESLEIRNALASALQRAGQPEEALVQSEIVITAQPTNPAALSTHGEILSSLDRTEEAIEVLRRSVEIDPKGTSALVALGVALRKQHRLEDAFVPLRQGAEIDPSLAAPRHAMGLVWNELGRPKEAEVEFRAAIERAPHLAEPHAMLGVLLVRMGRDDEARTVLMEALRIDPNQTNAWNALGHLHRKLRQYEEAIKAYRRASETAGSGLGGPSVNLARTLNEMGKDEEAEAAFREAIRKEPTLALAHFGLANFLMRKDRLEEAESAFRAAIAVDAEHAEAHCNLGSVLARLDRLDEAVAAIRRGHTFGSARRGWRYPSAQWLASSLVDLAALHRRDGLDKDALAMLLEAAQVTARKDAATLLRLAETQESIGETLEARKTVDDLLRLLNGHSAQDCSLSEVEALRARLDSKEPG
jgi:tetratricopeptide (TPR) repeat protein